MLDHNGRDQSPPSPKDFKPVSRIADINTAAALRAQYAIETPRPTRGRQGRHKKTVTVSVNSAADGQIPLVDNTEALELHSKKTSRLQKRQQKRKDKAANTPSAKSILDLPSELLFDILTHLQPSDIINLTTTSQTFNNFISENENLIARTIISTRYNILTRCFPLPIPLKSVPEIYHVSLLSPKRQELLNIHRKSYHQHVQMIDPYTTCTCMTCVFAWNNLNLITDLSHWQKHLEQREPIPMIARGSNPTWNNELLQRNATLVRSAMTGRTLSYAVILQRHLSTITSTILRFSRWKKKGPPSSSSNTTTTTTTTIINSPTKSRLYNMTNEDVETGTDAFLERSGPPSYDFPFHRDNYYTVEVYLPNRKWSAEEKKWYYYGAPPVQHERDLEWVRSATRVVGEGSSAGVGGVVEKGVEGSGGDGGISGGGAGAGGVGGGGGGGVG